MNKVTLRKCVCCKEMMDKRNLFRIVCSNSTPMFDPTGKAQGRGAYVCSNCAILEKSLKQSLSRALKTEISNEDYLAVIEGIKNCL